MPIFDRLSQYFSNGLCVKVHGWSTNYIYQNLPKIVLIIVSYNVLLTITTFLLESLLSL